MCKQSAGILAFRSTGLTEVLLVHPGGPFYKNKDLGVWSVPKGEHEIHEDSLAVAKKEFQEETGNIISSESFIKLEPVKNKSGKTLTTWAVEADFDPCYIASNTFELEWPPKSGIIKLFPECDTAEWFTLDVAITKLYPYQQPLIEQLRIINTKEDKYAGRIF
ncbi:MAG TPA: NUDIX domain-containing protein [Sphingobacteriaceae bacterium]|nr:NUDIX domain-containing protein [Sphingobacteriaceae bacterium]